MNANRTDSSHNSTHSATPTDSTMVDGLTPAEAHDLVVDLEHAGIPPESIGVMGDQAVTNADMAAADGLAASRAVRRITSGALAGAGIGAIIAILVDLTTDVPKIGAYLGLILVGAVLGGLAGLYRGLTLQQDAAATDLPGPKQVRVNEALIDDAHFSTVEEIVAAARRNNE